jgi:hypothetical protein
LHYGLLEWQKYWKDYEGTQVGVILCAFADLFHAEAQSSIKNAKTLLCLLMLLCVKPLFLAEDAEKQRRSGKNVIVILLRKCLKQFLRLLVMLRYEASEIDVLRKGANSTRGCSPSL